jgi:hypothetical protein
MTTTELSNTSNELGEVSLHQIADYLLKNSFLLTALELYEELLEKGIELQILKDFFTNENFIKQLENTKSPFGVEIKRSSTNVDTNSTMSVRLTKDINPQVAVH